MRAMAKMQGHTTSGVSGPAQMAAAAALIEHEPTDAQEDNELLSNSDWVIVTRDLAIMKLPEIAMRVKEITLPPRATLWTDDYNNLFRVLK